MTGTVTRRRLLSLAIIGVVLLGLRGLDPIRARLIVPIESCPCPPGCREAGFTQSWPGLFPP